jgi:hypothetical protein
LLFDIRAVAIPKNGDKNTWVWRRINIQYSPPYYKGMMCAARFSAKMMNCINNYANENKEKMQKM